MHEEVHWTRRIIRIAVDCAGGIARLTAIRARTGGRTLSSGRSGAKQEFAWVPDQRPLLGTQDRHGPDQHLAVMLISDNYFCRSTTTRFAGRTSC